MKQKKLISNFFVNRNWKKLADSRKRGKILADNRKYHHPIETLCTVVPLPHRHPFSDFFWGERAAVHRLSETDNLSSNCPSKLTDKVRRIVHSKLKPFPFQIKTYYLSDANYQTNNPSHTDNPSLSAKTAISVINECRAPASSWAFACLLLLFHED